MRISRENKAAMLAIMAVAALLFLILFFESRKLQGRVEANEAHHKELQLRIEEEEARTGEIEALREYMKSDDYARQAAKDRLGLIEEGEIVFKAR